MEVIDVLVSELSGMAAPYNPRRISDHDLEALRRSLRFFGTVEPVVVNRRSGRIVGGHQRVRAAEPEGLPSLPVVYVDLDDPSEKQLNIALNRISGEWDPEKLEAVLAELEAGGADMTLTGFTAEELEQLIHGGETPADGLTDPDAIPEPPDEPQTRLGALIVLGRHRLLCGDSADPEAVRRLLDGHQIQLASTDPPYNVQVEPRSNNAIAAAGKRRKNHQGLDLARHPEKAKPTGKMR